MSDGTVRGTFDLDTRPAVRGVREYRREAERADTTTRQLGGSINDAFGASQVAHIRAVQKETKGLATTTRDTRVKVVNEWKGMRREVQREAAAISSTISVVRDRMRQLSRETATPSIDLRGVTQALAQVTLLEKRLSQLSRSSSTPRVGLGGGMSAGGGASAFVTGGRGGGGRRGLGRGAMLAGAGVAALPFGQALGGAAVGLSGSAVGAGLGAGAAGAAGFGALAAGIGAIAPVAAQATAGMESVQKATEAYTKAVREYGRASKEAAAAERERNRAERLNPGAGRAVQSRTRLTRAFNRQTAGSRGQIYGGMSDVFDIARTRGLGTYAKNSLTATTAARGAATRQASFLTDRSQLGAFTSLTNSFARELPIAERTLENVEKTFLNIARASEPFFHDANVWVEKWTHGWRSSTNDIRGTREQIKPMVESFKDWRDLSGAVFRTVRDLFELGQPSGDSMVVSLTETFDSWDRWIQRNPAKVNAFFAEAADDTSKIASSIADIVRGLNHMATELRPLIAPLTRMVSLFGGLAANLSPGAAATAFLGVRGLRNGIAGGRGGGGGRGAIGAGRAGGGMVVGGGSGGAGGGAFPVGGTSAMSAAGGFMPFVFGGRAAMGGGMTRGQRVSRAYGGAAYGARQAGAGRLGAARAGLGGANTAVGRTGGYGRLAGGAAARGAGTLARFALPAALIGGLQGAFGSQGANTGQGFFGHGSQGIVNFAQGAGAMFGIANPVMGADERENRGQARAQKMLSQLPGGMAPTALEAQRAQRELRPELGRAEQQAADAAVKGGNDAKEAMAYLKVLRGQAQAYRDIARDAKHAKDARRSDLSVQRARAYAGGLQGAYNTYRKAGQGEQQAAGNTVNQLQDRMGKTKNLMGLRSLGDQSLGWARALEKENPKIKGVVNELSRSIEDRFQRMGRTVRVINGQIYTGTKGEWARIADQMGGATERAKQKTSADFTAIQNKAMASLRTLGFSSGDARELVQGLEHGGKTGAAASSKIGRQQQGLAGPTKNEGLLSGGRTSRARGGPMSGNAMIGGGTGTMDTVPVPGGMAAPGEAWIANKHTLADMSRATVEKYGLTAQQMIRGETRRHGAPEDPKTQARRRTTNIPAPQQGIMPGFARGGRAFALGGLTIGGSIGGSGLGASGSVGRGGAVADAGAGGGSAMAQMMAKANEIEAAHYPYVWGGGHGGFEGPYDCSGAVSAVLHAGGYLNAPVVSGSLAGMFEPGPGAVTIYANPTHTYMSLDGKFFGTSTSNPGGGAGWFPGSPRPGFTVRHVGAAGSAGGAVAINAAGAGAATVAKSISVSGMGRQQPGVPGALRQRAGDLYAAGLQKKVNASLAAAGGGGGMAAPGGLGAAGGGTVYGASMYGGAGDPGTGHIGYRGDDLNQKPDSYAELSSSPGALDFSAMGGLPYMQPLKVTGPSGSMTLYKRDVGGGGGAVDGHPRAIDLWYTAAQKLGINGLGTVKAEKMARGGSLAWGGGFAEGGSMVTNGPTAFIAGEGGRRRERVTVTPATPGGGGGHGGGPSVSFEAGSVVVKIGSMNGSGDVEALAAKVGERVARKIIESIDKGTSGVVG